MTENYPDVPSLTDYYGGDEPSLVPLKGWHTGTVVEFTDSKGNYYPSDTLSQKQDSRNLVLVIEFPNPTSRFGNQRVFQRLNYTREAIELASKLAIPKDWDEAKNAGFEREWFTARAFAGLQKAGIKLAFNGTGIETTPFIGAQLDVNLRQDKDGRTEANSFNPFAPAGSKVRHG